MLGSQSSPRPRREPQLIWYGLHWTRVAGAIGIIIVLLAAQVIFPAPAQADGGAPNLAYVAGGGSSGNDLVVVDIGQRRVSGSIAVGGNPAGVVLGTDGRYAYVTQSSTNSLAVVDASARKVMGTLRVGPRPTALALDLAQTPNLLIVADSGGNSVTVVNPVTMRTQATITVGRQPEGLAVALPGTGISETGQGNAEIYVANTESNTVSVISARQMRVIATIPTPGGPVAVTIPQIGGVAYVSTRSGTVLALSLATHQNAGVILHGGTGTLGAMDYDAVTGQIYVPDPAADVVYVLSPVALDTAGRLAAPPAEPVHVLSIAGDPVAVAVTFEGSYGFVAQRSSGTITMLDAATRRIQATITVGGAPRAIVTGAYPPAVSSQTSFLASMIVAAALLGIMLVTIGVNTRRRRGTAK